MLKSRGGFSSSEEFRDKFLEGLTPGIIPRKNFIDWNQIDTKFDKYKAALEFYKELGRLSRHNEEFEENLFYGLLSSDNPQFLVKTGFQLLGHTGDIYVSDEDYLKLSVIEKRVYSEDSDVDQKIIGPFVLVLCELGLRSVVKMELLDNYFLGVQVGLESNRRKNVGGKAFSKVVKSELEKILKKLEGSGIKCTLSEEAKAQYSDEKTSKKVDFLITDGRKKVGIEINFYTASGSKPSEIKRSYGQVNRELEKMGIELVWVTDGAGYFDMQNSLKEARDIHKNIYNLKMLKEDLEKDLFVYFSGGVKRLGKG